MAVEFPGPRKQDSIDNVDPSSFSTMTGMSDTEEEREGFMLGGGTDGSVLSYIGKHNKIKSKGGGVYVETGPYDLKNDVQLGGTFHSQFIPEEKRRKLSSNISDTKTLTVTKGGFKSDVADIKGYVFSLRDKTTKSGLSENSMTFGISFANEDDFKLKAAISQVWGEYQGKDFMQTGLHASGAKAFLGSVLRASGYVIGADDLGKLDDGSTLFIGESGDVVSIDKDKKIDRSVLGGLNLSSKTLLADKKAELVFSLGVFHSFEKEFGSEYAIRYGRIIDEGRKKFSVQLSAKDMLNQEEDIYELKLKFAKFFEGFRKDEMSLEFQVGYDTGSNEVSTGLKIRYYINKSGEDTRFDNKFKDYSNTIDTGLSAPDFERVSKY